MTFPCLVCGDVPVVDQPLPQPSGSAGARLNNNNLYSSPATATNTTTSTSSSSNNSRKSGGPTIRTLSKDVSDKIFQNLCRHLYVKTEPYWFIQNPGEQMPLCAFCSGVVLEIYTLQSKVDQFQLMIKKLVWKLERIVADTEIAGNWMATREEQESEQEMWNTLPCPPMAIKIARERHHKFRHQILLNFKSKVKQRQKIRATGQNVDEMYDLEPVLSSDPLFDSSGKPELFTSSPQIPTQAKRPRMDNENNINVRNLPSLIRAQLNHSPIPSRSSPSLSTGGSTQQGGSATSMLRLSQSPATQHSQGSGGIRVGNSVSLSGSGSNGGGGGGGDQNQDEEEYETDTEDDQNPPPVYPDVQIVCSVAPPDYLKEEHEYNSNSGDGEESMMEQDASFWNSNDDNMEDAMSIPDGEDVVWLAPGLALRKSFINQLLSENLKASVFLRKLVFAVFGMKQVANSSGICGSNKPGAKPSLDRFKFEALREYTIETYGIRDNITELEDLNRKIRTICCDARKALKRKVLKSNVSTISGHSNMLLESLAAAPTSSSSTTPMHSEIFPVNSTGNIPDLFQISTDHHGASRDHINDDDEDDEHMLPQIPVSVSLEEQPGDVQH